MSIAELITDVLGGDLPVAVKAYDGSRTGPADATATIVIASPRALVRLAHDRGELGVGRAYVAGDLDIQGDLFAALALQTRLSDGLPRSVAWKLARAVGPRVLRRPPNPPEEARLRGRRHVASRDAKAISHHYDVGNPFYERVLGPAMTYSCAVWESPGVGLEAAQAAKLELVCRKLALEPGMRLLDIGCGWGAMVRHAARHHGVRAVGVTISEEQAKWARARVVEEGLQDRIEIRIQDYREIPDGPFDAVSSIGMFEHVGIEQLPTYVGVCRDLVRPGGRVLNHGITNAVRSAAISPKSFMGKFVFPDGELPELGDFISANHAAGLEVRHSETLREHYALTLRAWVANLEANWDECVALAGEGRARVWRLYMAGCARNFERGSIQVHQVLAVRPGGSPPPLRPDWDGSNLSVHADAIR